MILEESKNQLLSRHLYGSPNRTIVQGFIKKDFVYFEAVQMAFSSDAREAFEGSISLAAVVGVPDEEILDTPQKVREYFL